MFPLCHTLLIGKRWRKEGSAWTKSQAVDRVVKRSKINKQIYRCDWRQLVRVGKKQKKIKKKICTKTRQQKNKKPKIHTKVNTVFGSKRTWKGSCALNCRWQTAARSKWNDCKYGKWHSKAVCSNSTLR